jgi:beta-N-acetylhexosaminidase
MQLKHLSHPLMALTVLAFVLTLVQPVPVVQAETRFQTSQAQAVLAQMTPEERVGQLFLISFQGTDAHDQTRIYDLIANRHVGGIVLSAGNDNFLPPPDTIPSAHRLISTLQTIESTATTESELDAQSDDKVYVPLFIGISQEGDGRPPYDQILNGLTPLPNPMAIGATWRTDLAQQVGRVLGSELSALGFNLYLGPALDVVEAPNPSARNDLGPRVFGGDPFWVGEMGRAYISGLHTGSNGRMVVVAKHFPGRGDSDRSPEEEVATVRKSLEQLTQVELPPFFAVTDSMDATELADGLLVSHIRYQLQGNIRATTRPVSLDESALSAMTALPEFATWRTNDGLIVSDALGSQAVRDFYAQTGENFSPRLVARDAFLAGNDLLYLGNITSEESAGEDTYTATLAILDFFAQQYRSDRDFAQRVDQAVTRILAQKMRMYGEFILANALTPESGLANVGSSHEVVFEVARNAATLISPDAQELNNVLSGPPTQGERIAFLTDTASYKQCTVCLAQEGLPADALQKEVLRLYGSTGSGQVYSSRLNSFPLTELEAMLNGESATDIEGILERADWLVISLTGVSNGQLSLLQRFFSERPNLTRDRNVILFAFTAPYYLDATDISRLTAYYALYSKQPAFVEAAARLLFQPGTLQGASPVSIPAMRYDLRVATSPNPTQIIPLSLDKAEEIPPASETSTAEVIAPTPTEVPLYSIGDTIAIRAGPILDHNGHLVPDETPVRFTMSTLEADGPILQQVDVITVDGLARASFKIDRPGKVEIRAASEPALNSIVLQFDAGEDPKPVTIVSPTPLVTDTPGPIVPTLTPIPESDLVSPEGYPRVGIWLLVMLALVGGAALMFWAVSRIVSLQWGLRWALCVFLGGLLAYNYLALGFPGAAEWIAASAGAFGVLVLTFSGEALGALGAWAWMQLLANQSREKTNQ